MRIPRNRERHGYTAVLVSSLALFTVSCETAGPDSPAEDPDPVGVRPLNAGGNSESPGGSLTAEVATVELRQAVERWVAAIRAGDTTRVRALIATEADLRTFVGEAQLRIILDTRPDRGTLLDRLVNSARDQPIEIVQFVPGHCAVLPPGGRRPEGPDASFDHCALRLSYGGLEIDLDLLHPMRFPFGWRVLEIRKLATADR